MMARGVTRNNARASFAGSLLSDLAQMAKLNQFLGCQFFGFSCMR
jgi:hypothetical protein